MVYQYYEEMFQTVQENKRLRKYVRVFLLFSLISTLITGCRKEMGQTEIEIFVAASLKQAMEEIITDYKSVNNKVQINLHADSSGTLLTQIEEGYECDIFFSAAEKQMDQLEQDGLVVETSRQNVLNNQVVLIKAKGQKTEVTGLETLDKADSIALAAGSVPVGRYTREALKNLGILESTEDSANLTTAQVSKALGGIEISEQSNVSKVLLAVAEGSCEVGTVYMSDTYGYEDKVEIIEIVSNELTGDVVYPVCLVANQEADAMQKEEAKKFYDYLLSKQAKEVFVNYKFDINENA